MTDTRSDDSAISPGIFADTPPAGDRLPIPPLRLRRIYLQGVGPDGARFDPLDLDFTASGGAASRVLLSLTNTGGKSTLITLISSLVVPASRAQVGGKNLGDYVLTGDTSHIVCEWEDATTSVRTVTGTVMEWKDGRRQPGHKQRSTTNMHRAWYLFRTGPGLPRVDDLPLIIDGRRASFETYVTALTSLVSPYSQARWVLARTQQDWTRTLQDHTNLDPVLFGYQMRMNDSEAGAEKLLATFDSPDNVVRFFVAALNDDREMTDFTAKLSPYADLAGGREELEALAGFGAQIAPLVARVADRKAAVDEMAATALKARAAGGEHATALKNRVAQDEATLSELEQEVAAAAQELAAARREYGQISDIRLQLQLEQARTRLAEAVRVVGELTQLSAREELEADAWDAVNAVLDTEVARQERDSAQAAYDAAHAGLGPLRAQVATAAATLAGRLDGLISEAGAAARAADELVIASQDAQDRALEDEKTAERARDQARRQLTEITEKVRAATDACTAATKAGWLPVGEHPDRCLRRWQHARGVANASAEEEDGKAAAAESSFDTAVRQLQSLDDELVELRRSAERDQARLESFDADLAGLADDDAVSALLGGAPTDVRDARRAGEMADNAANDADRRAADHERLSQVALEELAHLDETGTAPTGPDALAVLEVLRTAHIGAVGGLDWIERNVAKPDDRPAFIAAHPDIAGGVIVSDPVRFAPAVEQITAACPRTRTPVTVTTAAACAMPPHDGDDGGLRYVVVPHRATWDRAWATATRAELDATATSEGRAATQARAAAARHREASALCAAFISRWHATTGPDLSGAASASTQKVTSAEQQRGKLVTDRDRYRQTASTARNRAAEARRDAHRADQNAAAATQLVQVTSEAATAGLRRPAAETALSDALQQLGAASAARKAATACQRRPKTDPLLASEN